MRSLPKKPTRADGHDSDPPSGVRPRDPFTKFVTQQTALTLRSLKKLGISWADRRDYLQKGLLYTWERHRNAPPEEWPHRLRSAIWNVTKKAGRTFAVAKKHEPKLAFEAHNDAAESESHVPPEYVIGAREVDARLQAAIDALPPDQRLVTRLHFLYDLELNEIADILGGEPETIRKNLPFLDETQIEEIAGSPRCALETVKKRWRLAREKLRAVVLRTRKKEKRTTGGFVSYAILLWLCRQQGGRVRQGTRALLAVAAVSLFVASHSTLGSGARAALPAEAASEASREASALADVSGAILEQGKTGSPASITPNEAARTESTEPGRRASSVPRRSPPSPRAAGTTALAGHRQRTSQELVTARKFLVTAAAALRAGNRAAGRGALEEYRLDFPDNPYPQQYREVTAALDSLDDAPPTR